MKKLHASIFVCLLFSIAYSQTIPFPAGRLKTYLTTGFSLMVAKDLAGNTVTVDSNNDHELQYSEVERISYLSFTANTTIPAGNLYNVDGLEYFIHLQYLDLDYHELSTLDVSMFPELKTLSVQSNNLTTINLNGLTHLESFTFFGNPFAVLHLHDLPALTTLNENLPNGYWGFGTGSHTLIFENLPMLAGIYCGTSNVNSLQLINMNGLTTLSCANNQLATLDLTGAPNLITLEASNNNLTSVNVSGVPNLRDLYVSTNSLSSIDFASIPQLAYFKAEHNLFTSIDLSGLTHLAQALLAYNSLEYAFLKNGRNYSVSAFNNGYLSLNYNPGLKYICADEYSVDMFKARMVTYGYNNVEVNTYCSFNPGGAYYTVTGHANNGCSALGLPMPNVKLNVTTGSLSGTYNIADDSGDYYFPVTAGNYTITPILENPMYYSVTPTSINVSFPSQVSPVVQNFCISPIGDITDLEVVLLPTSDARPGFNARYKIIYKNKGTNIKSGTVNLAFNQAVSELIYTHPDPSNEVTNNLTWSFSNLNPMETRTIEFTLNLNTPFDTPPLNGNSVLNYTASIDSGVIDQTTNDNTFILNQTVVNSFDPNDKTCLEGDKITPEMVGKEVHYLIRFENTGTANAQNIVVKDMIDTSKFDINSLIPLSGSHAFVTKISGGNKVEFIFENINLPFDDANNDGYVAFKIKTKPTLVLGNTFSNTANIYFDYNFPIITNTATTTVALLANADFAFEDYFRIYPVPVKDVLNIEFKKSIQVSSIQIYNTLGQLVLTVPSAQQTKTVDVSGLKTGNYVVKVNSSKGSSSAKFVKS